MAQVVGCKIEAKYNLEQATVWDLDELDKVRPSNLAKRGSCMQLATPVCS